MKEVQILLVENISLTADGILAILKQDERISKVFWAKDGTAAYSILASEKINLIILDLHLDHQHYEVKKFQGVAIAKEIKQKSPDTKILIFTEYIRSQLYIELKNTCHIEGYLDKQSGKDEILNAIEKIMSGNHYIDKNLESILAIGQKLRITNREQEVAELLAQGKRYKEIASDLHRSERTVESHVIHLKEKFKAKSNAELIKKYLLDKVSKNDILID